MSTDTRPRRTADPEYAALRDAAQTAERDVLEARDNIDEHTREAALYHYAKEHRDYDERLAAFADAYEVERAAIRARLDWIDAHPEHR